MRQLIVTLLAFSLIALAACSGQQGLLKPMRPSPTPGGQIIGQPIPVTFSQLHENPAQYQDQLIRISGRIINITVEPCRHKWGPQIQWALIADNLRLDSVGYEQILRLVPEGTEMTIDGWWRLYGGPLGCAKKPPAGFAWYLETAQIIIPNPLPQFGAPPPTVDAGAPPMPTAEATPTTGTATATVTAATPGPGTPTVTPPSSGFSTLTPTPTRFGGATNTPTATPMGGTTAPTPSRTATAGVGTIVPTATPSRTPSATPTAGATPTGVAPPPPIATVTPGGGYEPPPPPPPGTPTSTSTPYP